VADRRKIKKQIIRISAECDEAMPRTDGLKRLEALLDNAKALTSQDSWRGVS
jgi:hypothetical protein